MSLARTRTQTARSGDERTNHEAAKDRDFESLLTQNYSSFILAIKCIGTSIFRTDKGCYKIFDSHANVVEAIRHKLEFRLKDKSTFYCNSSVSYGRKL